MAKCIINVNKSVIEKVKYLLSDGYGLESIAHVMCLPIHVVYGIKIGEIS